jgi:HEPN domain-containing protein
MAEQTNTSRDWRLLAERDLSVAEHLANSMRPIPTEIIAFLCQQATEKYLKGALVILGDEPPYIHNVDKLCIMAEKHRPSFVSILPLCTIITQFSVQPRYDLGLSVSEDDMNIVLAHTKTIRDFLQKEIPELFEEKN